MPWSGDDATKHNKSVRTSADKRLWNAVANRILKQSGDEGKAIRIANSQVHRSAKK